MVSRPGVRSILSALAAVGLGVVGAFSLHDGAVDAQPVSDDFGTVSVNVHADDSRTGLSSMRVAGMRPGDTTAGVLVVENSGPAPLEYHVDATYSDDEHGFGAALSVKVTDADATVGSGRATRCPGDRLGGTARSFSPMLIGSGQAGRTLAAGASETLCLQARLPLSAPSRLQGVTTRVELEVVARP